MDGTQADDPDAKIIKEFGRHFVSLTCDYYDGKKKGSGERFVTSGFLMSIADVWYMATAGHVINDITKRMEQEPQRTYHFGIIDNFGSDARHGEIIPFDFRDALKWTTDHEITGADFGLILIEPFYRRLIEANHPMPFTEKQWRYERVEPFEHYFMMGIPAETVKKVNAEEKQYEMAMMALTELKELPPGIEPRPYPTFYGELGPTRHINSIKGMSGCPIFGFAKDDQGNWRYWIVAVQITWYPERTPRIIAASLFKELALDAEAYFAELLEEHVE